MFDHPIRRATNTPRRQQCRQQRRHCTVHHRTAPHLDGVRRPSKLRVEPDHIIAARAARDQASAGRSGLGGHGTHGSACLHSQNQKRSLQSTQGCHGACLVSSVLRAGWGGSLLEPRAEFFEMSGIEEVLNYFCSAR